MTGCDAGVSVSTFTWISPVFDEENACARAEPGWTVPENESTVFCDGSTMPPQLMLKAPAHASRNPADERSLIRSILHGSDASSAYRGLTVAGVCPPGRCA